MWKEGEGVVLKFGGTSVSSPEKIRAAARRAAVVVSAMGGAIDELIGLGRAVRALHEEFV